MRNAPKRLSNELVGNTPQRRMRGAILPDTPRRYSIVTVGLLVVSVLTFVAFPLSSSAGDAALAATPNTSEILVKFKATASQMAIDALNASMATQQVDTIPALGVRVLHVPPSRAAGAVVQAYAHNPLVEFAEVNAVVPPEVTPNDPSYSLQWHLSKIQVSTAWDNTRATGVLIAICDTGVASVPDLTPVLRGDLGWNAVDGSTNWTDVDGHGTEVAGAAAATANNSVGVAGVAWGAQIIPVRISNLAGGSAYISDAAKCIAYGADHGARVINVSYLMAGSTTIDSAGSYAQSKGAVTTVAAGNNAQDPGWPNLTGFLAISATNVQDNLATWSNFGAFVDVAAPGSGIWTTMKDGTYGSASGTSFSSPVAAGVLALIFGANPSLSAVQGQNILLSSADDLGGAGWDMYFGAGRVNANRAVLAALVTGPSATSTPVPSPTATSTASIATSTPMPSSTATVGPTPTSTPTPSSTVTVSPTPTSTPTPGSTATMSPIPTSTPTAAPPPFGSDIVPPTVSLTNPGQGQSVRGSTSMSATASDNVGVVRVEFYIDGALYKTVTSAPFSTNWNTRRWSNGSHTITSKAFDGAGNSASDAHLVTVSN